MIVAWLVHGALLGGRGCDVRHAFILRSPNLGNTGNACLPQSVWNEAKKMLRIKGDAVTRIRTPSASTVAHLKAAMAVAEAEPGHVGWAALFCCA